MQYLLLLSSHQSSNSYSSHKLAGLPVSFRFEGSRKSHKTHELPKAARVAASHHLTVSIDLLSKKGRLTPPEPPI